MFFFSQPFLVFCSFSVHLFIFLRSNQVTLSQSRSTEQHVDADIREDADGKDDHPGRDGVGHDSKREGEDPGQGRDPARAAATDLRRQTVGGWPHPL